MKMRRIKLAIRAALALSIFFMLFALIPIGVPQETITQVFYPTQDMVITDWQAFWSTFRQHAKWRLEVDDGSGWELSSGLTIDREITEIGSQMQACKITLIFDAPKAGDYRFTFGIDKHARQYVHKENSWNYTLAYQGYAVNFDWSDVKDIPNILVTHGIKEIEGKKWFWFRIRRDNVPQGAHIEIDPTISVYSTSSDTWAWGYHANYATAHISLKQYTTTEDSAWFGQFWFVGPDVYEIDRMYFYFDTSSIPSGSTISSATLSLFGGAEQAATDFNITIQNGQPTYPHDPFASATDYHPSHYSGNGGEFDTSGFVEYARFNITMTELTWITIGGTTKLIIRSSRDIAEIPPTGYEMVTIYMSEYAGTSRDPKLIVTYVPPPPPSPSDIETSTGSMASLVALMLPICGVILGIGFVFLSIGLINMRQVGIEEGAALIVVPLFVVIVTGIVFLTLTALGGL